MTSIFTLPAAEVSWPVLASFLNDCVPEDLNLEYKRELTRQIPRSVAAMANTYGGVILVGVAENNGLPVSPPQGVALAARDALANQLFAKLEPPFEPEMIPVPIDGQEARVVLVVRVAPPPTRPVVTDGSVYIRLRGQNQPADRYRIASLFAESDRASGGQALPALPSGRGAHAPTEGAEEALIIRASMSVAVPPGREPFLNTRQRRLLAGEIRTSAVEKWIAAQAPVTSGWIRSGWVTESTETLRRDPREFDFSAANVGGQTVFELSASTHSGGWATLIVDVIVRPAPDHSESPPMRFAIEELSDLIHVLLRTVIDEVGPRAFEMLTGLRRWRSVGPAVSLDTGSETLSRYVRFDAGWPRAYGASDRAGPFFDTPFGVDATDVDARKRLVRNWLSQMLYNQGFTDFESQLEAR